MFQVDPTEICVNHIIITVTILDIEHPDSCFESKTFKAIDGDKIIDFIMEKCKHYGIRKKKSDVYEIFEHMDQHKYCCMLCSGRYLISTKTVLPEKEG